MSFSLKVCNAFYCHGKSNEENLSGIIQLIQGVTVKDIKDTPAIRSEGFCKFMDPFTSMVQTFDFNDEKILVFSYRLDTKKLNKVIFKKKLKEAIAEELELKGVGSLKALTKEERLAIKEIAAESVQVQMAPGVTPEIEEIEIIWNIDSGELLLGTTSLTRASDVLALLSSTVPEIDFKMTNLFEAQSGLTQGDLMGDFLKWIYFKCSDRKSMDIGTSLKFEVHDVKLSASGKISHVKDKIEEFSSGDEIKIFDLELKFGEEYGISFGLNNKGFFIKKLKSESFDPIYNDNVYEQTTVKYMELMELKSKLLKLAKDFQKL